ncbi:FAD-binding protein [Phocoenobacter atlanticus]|uniref:FAD-binding protein n=1 Tax=Phocoenobacter atlanticus TaxID=3416742 RepID=UPI002765E831|nr:FAD-binding protein [Pasteurella atlantica]MDP8101673.1 FAD-binding protein [Pasteurella atlantica]
MINKKSLFYVLTALLIIFISIPAFHLIKTYLNEDNSKVEIPKGYTNDASELNLTKVDQIIDVAQSKEAIISQLKDILKYAKTNHKAISMAGAKHSMGGHTMYPDGIVLNMRPYNQMQLDTTNNILTIGSGALWEEALNYLDQFDKSIVVMQAFSSFSIGGSISVNGHGWQKDSPPVSSSVISFTLMDHNGNILNCSRTENPELFSLVIGGYGLFGIILDVKLKVVDNEALQFKSLRLEPENYVKEYKKFVSDNPKVKLAFGRLRISNKEFLEEATLNYFEQVEQKPLPLEQGNAKSTEAKRLVFRSSVNSEYGKRLRWDLEKGMNEITENHVFSRNDLLNDNVKLIENKDNHSTDILHEYFIPERNVTKYINALKTVLPNQQIDLLNITIRNVYQDNDSYLNYARENVFGFVFLFNQKKSQEDELEMQKLTKALVNIALEMEGTYYLPYRLHIDKPLFNKVYPQGQNFFKLKLKYDPDELFNNKFYQHYK